MPDIHVLISHRLDQQSNIIRIVRGGHVLDPSIPKGNMSKIADIATGTGYEYSRSDP